MQPPINRFMQKKLTWTILCFDPLPNPPRLPPVGITLRDHNWCRLRCYKMIRGNVIRPLEKLLTLPFARTPNQGQLKCRWLLRAWGNRKHQELFQLFWQLRLLLEVILFVGTNTWHLISILRGKKIKTNNSRKIRSFVLLGNAYLLWNYKQHFCNC